MPIRCLIVAPLDLRRPAAGGIRSFVEGFIKFAPEDFAIEVVGLGGGDRGWQTLEVGQRTVRVLPVLTAPKGHRRSLIPLSMQFSMAVLRRRRLINTEGRIIQVHRPGMLLPFLGRSSPTIQFLHFESDQVAGGDGENRWRHFPSVLHGLELLTLPRLAAVITVSEATGRDYAARHPEIADRVHVVPNWVDETIFYPLSGAERAALRARLVHDIGADDEDRLALFVGRLERTKDPGVAIKALAEVLPDTRPWHLVFVGDGSLLKSLRYQARMLRVGDRVHFLGSRPRTEVAAWMKCADALIVSSRSEAGPTVALEALATGLPVVGTQVGRLPALIRSGESGWLAAVGSATEVAAGLQWAANIADRPVVSCLHAARSYSATAVLQPLYALHRRLVS